MAFSQPASFGILANVTRECGQLAITLHDPFVPFEFKEMLPGGAGNSNTPTLAGPGRRVAQARFAGPVSLTKKGRKIAAFRLVEIRGVEPLTFSMPLRRSTN